MLSTVYLFLALMAIAFVLSLFKRKIGYYLGILYGVLNILAAGFMLVGNKIPAGNSLLKPVNVIVTCLLIVYFYYLEARQQNGILQPRSEIFS